MSLRDEISTPYAISFATNSSCERQSKAFERYVSNAPKTWSRDCLHVSNKLIKQYWTLKPFPNPHWYFEHISPKNTESWLYKHLSKTFDKCDNMLIGLQLSLLVQYSFLKSSISDGNLPNCNDLLNSWCKSVKMSKLSLTIFAGMSDFSGIWRNQTFLNVFLFQ